MRFKAIVLLIILVMAVGSAWGIAKYMSPPKGLRIVTMDNKCVMERRYTCGTHSQKECFFFEQNPSCPTTLCNWGQSDCDCRSKSAIVASFLANDVLIRELLIKK
jgi:hypothetical protein